MSALVSGREEGGFHSWFPGYYIFLKSFFIKQKLEFACLMTNLVADMGKKTNIRIRTYEKRILIKCKCFCIRHLLSVISAHFPENYHHLMLIIDSFLDNKNKGSTVYFFFFNIFPTLLHTVHAIQFLLDLSCSCHQSKFDMKFCRFYPFSVLPIIMHCAVLSLLGNLRLQFSAKNPAPISDSYFCPMNATRYRAYFCSVFSNRKIL
jgi:hypothetical protein